MPSFYRKEIDWENCPQQLITKDNKPHNVHVVDSNNDADFWSCLDEVFSGGHVNTVVWTGAPRIDDCLADKILSGPVRNCNGQPFLKGRDIVPGNGVSSLSDFEDKLYRSFLIPDPHILKEDIPKYQAMVDGITNVFNGLNEAWPDNDHKACLMVNSGLAKTSPIAKFNPHYDGAGDIGETVTKTQLNLCWIIAGPQTVVFDNSEFETPKITEIFDRFNTPTPTIWQAERGAAVILPALNTFSKPAVHATPFHLSAEKPQKRIFLRSRVILDP